MSRILIFDYVPAHQPWFEKFNRQWIEEMFEIEPLDEWVLTNPGQAIIEQGGAILMASWDGVIAGTVGLRRLDDDTFEFTKMAVDPAYRKRGLAAALSLASFRKAAALGAKNIVLYSNRKNAAAIRLYEKLGFRHLPVEAGLYKRADVKMIIAAGDALAVSNQKDAVLNDNFK